MTGDPWEIAASASQGRSPRHLLLVPRAARTSPSSWDAAHRTYTHSYTDTGRRGEEREERKERKKKKERGKGRERREGEQITAGRKYGENGTGREREWGESMEKEEAEEDYRTLCSHTNACVSIHTYRHTHWHLQADYMCTWRRTYNFSPRWAISQASLSLMGFDSYLGFVSVQHIKSRH